MSHNNKQNKPWIRGVNIGGWLLLERFITPYFFALTTCHLRGDFRFYPQQINAPPSSSPTYKLFNSTECKPIVPYPVDEYTLSDAFTNNKTIGRKYMELHWDNFVTENDVHSLVNAGVTHVRVPLSHWIMGDIRDDEPWIDGAWPYFVRFVSWCRKVNIQVWPDIHTAPGSQNGFDNSGQLLPVNTCVNWSNKTDNVERSLKVIKDVTEAIVSAGLDDVVTGFGVLNEPWQDCGLELIRRYNEDALRIVRDTLGNDTAVYIGDMFNATMWNDGWWTNGEEYGDTYLDSHYYHVFAERPRALSPRQHIAYVCRKNYHDTIDCCYDNKAATDVVGHYDDDIKIPSKGISRIIGEWSAAYDTLVAPMLDLVMDGIAANGTAPFFERQISKDRKTFLRNFVEAQILAYEASNTGVSSGWFYWTFKMEGGAFAEWDFLRGIQEGWIPKIQSPDIASGDLYGTCENIIYKTNDSMSVIHEFPDPNSFYTWQGDDIDDDLVVSHGESLLPRDTDDNENNDDNETVVSEEASASTNDDIYDNEDTNDDENENDDDDEKGEVSEAGTNDNEEEEEEGSSSQHNGFGRVLDENTGIVLAIIFVVGIVIVEC